MNNLKKWLCMGFCAVMALGLAGCENKKPERSSLPESSDSTISSTPAPESSRFTPAEDLISTPSGVEEGSFEDLFSQNPIDKKYDQDYSLASSFSMMRQACNQAARSWRDLIDTVYPLALEQTPEEEKSALQAEQTEWETTVEDRITAIREEAGDTNESVLSSSQQVVLLYRERAMALCKIIFEATGQLPEFPSPEGGISSAVG